MPAILLTYEILINFANRKILSMVSDLQISEFDYTLPDERIARHPLAERDRCRLLLSRPDGVISHRIFTELPALLPPSCLLVANDTKVINARIAFHKATGSRIEIFLLEPIEPADYALMFQSRGVCTWGCLVGNLKRWKEGPLSLELSIRDVEKPVILQAFKGEELPGNGRAVRFEWDNPSVTFAQIVDAAGNIPIPPYLKRDSEESDSYDYQTVYAKVKGSVAAPTAGLHFTQRVLDDLAAHNVELRKVTLHVGAGTFQPVKSATIGGHPMHTESFVVERSLVEALILALSQQRPVGAVGTTTVRTLESLPYIGHRIMQGVEHLTVDQWEPYEGASEDFDTLEALRALLNYMDTRSLTSLAATTSIMIAPGFRWRIVDCMVTNFHQPQSTLLLLVSSFLDRDAKPADSPDLQWRRIYEEALASDYRFLSYGDACLLFPCR